MLDRIDIEILRLLQNDARLSNKALASAVGLAPSSCLERVRRMREQGVIRGAHLDVDPAALGIRLEAMIAVKLQQHARDAVLALEADLIDMEEVIALYHVAGGTDYLIHVAVRDADHLRRIALDRLGARSEIRDIETALIFGHRRRAELPVYKESSKGK